MKKLSLILVTIIAWVLLILGVFTTYPDSHLAFRAWFDPYPSAYLLTYAGVLYTFAGLFFAILAIISGYIAKPRFFWVGTMLYTLIFLFTYTIGLRPLYRYKYLPDNLSNVVVLLIVVIFLISSTVFFFDRDRHKVKSS